MGEMMAQQPNVVDISRFSDEDQAKARKLADSIDITDSQAVIQFGVGTQAKIGHFADTILTEIRAKDTGYVGDALTDLVTTVKEVNVGNISTDSGPLSRLFGGLLRRIQKFLARYQKLSTHVDEVVNQLDTARMNLLRDVTMLDNLHEKNQEYLKELDLLIAAGQVKSEQVRNEVIPALEKQAEESGDPMDAQRLQDMNQLLNRLEKKIHDLLLSRMISIQTAPQIRLIQGNNQTLVEKIQSSILNTIPLWKNQIVIALSLFRQKKALEVQREVTDTTNELLAKNSEMLKQGAIEIDGVVTIEEEAELLILLDDENGISNLLHRFHQ